MNTPRDLRVLPRWAIAAVAIAVAVLTALTVSLVLVWIDGMPLSGKDQATVRLDALKIGLSVGVGGGGVFALYLAARRQRSIELQLQQAERVAEVTAADATERRVTDLYAMAASQLGSDSLTVRVAGVYALDRLAQTNPDHRQTIVNLLCAYLRMPVEETLVGQETVREIIQDLLAAHLRPAMTGYNKQVHPRLAVPRPDAPPNPTFWADIDLDLSGATLDDVMFDECRMGSANFYRTTFTNGASFFGAEFTGVATFAGAMFDGRTEFAGATFHEVTSFGDASFTGQHNFEGVSFGGRTDLGATFEVRPWLRATKALARSDVQGLHRWPPGWDLAPMANPDDGEWRALVPLEVPPECPDDDLKGMPGFG